MTDQEYERYQRHREGFLALFLCLIGGGAVLLFLIAITGGFFLYVLLAVVAMALLGSVHYLLWGRALSQGVAGEREEMELREQAEEDSWPLPEARQSRHD